MRPPSFLYFRSTIPTSPISVVGRYSSRNQALISPKDCSRQITSSKDVENCHQYEMNIPIDQVTFPLWECGNALSSMRKQTFISSELPAFTIEVHCLGKYVSGFRTLGSSSDDMSDLLLIFRRYTLCRLYKEKQFG